MVGLGVGLVSFAVENCMNASIKPNSTNRKKQKTQKIIVKKIK